MTHESLKNRLVVSLSDNNLDIFINPVIEWIDEVSWDIDRVLLEVVPQIENSDVRNICRTLFLAHKYNASEDYLSRQDINQPWLDYVGDECALLQYREKNDDRAFFSSTAILSSQGDILTPKGRIWVGGSSLSFNHCFIARGVKGEHDRMGLVFIDGRILLPCVFDNIVDDVAINTYYNAFHMKRDAMGSYEREYSLGEGLSIIISIVVSKIAPDKGKDAIKSMTELFAILDNFYGQKASVL